MKRSSIMICFLFLIVLFSVPAFAGLDDFLKNINIQAHADLRGFNVKLSAQFGVPVPRVEAIVKTVAAPADAFMVLELGRMAQKPPEAVMKVYQRDHGKGWGAMAKELGIKPGSPQFHALKNGDLSFTGQPGGAKHHKVPGKDNGKKPGKGKGHGKKTDKNEDADNDNGRGKEKGHNK